MFNPPRFTTKSKKTKKPTKSRWTAGEILFENLQASSGFYTWTDSKVLQFLESQKAPCGFIVKCHNKGEKMAFDFIFKSSRFTTEKLFFKVEHSGMCQVWNGEEYQPISYEAVVEKYLKHAVNFETQLPENQHEVMA